MAQSAPFPPPHPTAPTGGNRKATLDCLAPTPPDIKARLENDTLLIEQRWYQVGYVVSAALCAGTLLWLGWLVGSDLYERSAVSAFSLVLGVLLGPLCLGLLYWTLVGILETTDLTARPDGVTLRHRPLWWPGGRTLPVRDLARVVVYLRVFNAGRGRMWTYALRLEYADGSSKRLWLGIHEGETADYVARALSTFYGVAAYTTDDKEREQQEAEKNLAAEENDDE